MFIICFDDIIILSYTLYEIKYMYIYILRDSVWHGRRKVVEAIMTCLIKP